MTDVETLPHSFTFQIASIFLKSQPVLTKTLALMRHAKSDWGTQQLADFARPLNKRGRHAATQMASWISRVMGVPDAILSSGAQRTRETTLRMVEVWSAKPLISFLDTLYLAPAEQILRHIAAVPEGTRSLLVVGHNPGMEELVSSLAQRPTAFPTAAVAIFSVGIDIPWAEIDRRDELQLQHLGKPKELAGE